MQIDKVKVYDLEESIIASGYPMRCDLSNTENEVNDLKYWLDNGLSNMINILKEPCKYKLNDDFISMSLDGSIVKFSPEDLEMVDKYDWYMSGGYAKCKDGHMHVLIFNNSDYECVDHINKDKLDNTRNNLRGATMQQNTFNGSISTNNTSGVTGVSFRTDRNKWRSYIMVDNKQIFLGQFTNIDDAIRERLNAEVKYYCEFAPQKHLFDKYNIEYKEYIPARTPIKEAINHYKRACKLSHAKRGSGHDQSLRGILVAFDLTFTMKAWIELERYTFVNFVSSQSTMHRITKMDLKSQCNSYVYQSTIDMLNEDIVMYNKWQEIYTTRTDTDDRLAIKAMLEELFLRIIYNIPSGLQLTARLSTNYQALKTIYDQRQNHRLPEWREFCKWIEELPKFKELILNE